MFETMKEFEDVHKGMFEESPNSHLNAGLICHEVSKLLVSSKLAVIESTLPTESFPFKWTLYANMQTEMD